MFLYTFSKVIVVVVAGIVIAVCAQKAEGVNYTKLDKAGQITNILLIPVYAGLGFSAALRKKGKSKQSFAMQFAGLAGVVLSLILFFVFYGNLLSSLN